MSCPTREASRAHCAAAAAPTRTPESQFLLTNFDDFLLNDAITRALAEENPHPDPDPVADHSDRHVGPRRDRHCTDRNRQDRRIRAADPASSCRDAALAGAQKLPRSGAEPDARTVRPDPRQLPRLWPPPAAAPTLAIGGVSMGARSARCSTASTFWSPRRAACSISSKAMRCASTRSNVWCSTKPTACSTWVSSTTSGRSSPSCRAQRQTLMFSATMPRAIAELAAQMLRDPVKVAVAPVARRSNGRAAHHSRRPAGEARDPGRPAARRADRSRLIFTRTKHGADKVARGLVRAGIAADAIHGNKSQNQRERVLTAFRQGELRSSSPPTSPRAVSTSTASAMS